MDIRLNTPDEDKTARHMAMGHGLVIDRASTGVVADRVESWYTLEDAKASGDADELTQTLDKLAGIEETNMMDYTVVRLINSQTPVILWLSTPEFVKYLALALVQPTEDNNDIPGFHRAQSPN